VTLPRTVEIELVGGARDGRRSVIDRDLLRLWSDTTPHPPTGLMPRRYHYQWFMEYLAGADYAVRIYRFIGETAPGERLHPADRGGTA
jgi:hypothetical protein